ncbi:MAG: radical SAM protein [Bacteroidales bacterium]|nr:lipid biosynthesis B12-binding/radical SAM protein [Bacteroidales bacterium]NLK79275.1 radical SAM protein [Bacteroidales bacterium]
MKRIALISVNNFKIPYIIFPIGISYISTYLNEKMPEWQTEVFDFNMGDYEDLTEFCRNGNFKYIGISVRNIDDTNYYEQISFMAHYHKIMQIIRENSNAVVLMGGSGFSIYPGILFRELQPDWGIHGEGEENICKLITALEQGADPHVIDGLVYRKPDGSIGINEHKQHISSLTLHVEQQIAHFYFEKSGMLNIQTKRGCPYHCIYCSYPIIEGHNVRLLDPVSVVENIIELKETKGIDYLFFTDSVFNIHKEYNRELASLLIQKKAGIKWGAFFTPHNLSFEDLSLYRDAGLKHIEWGTDSLSDSQLERLNKSFRFSHIKEQSLNASKLGIFYAHFLLLGGYGETDQSLDETFEHSKELGRTVFFPFVGMRIYPRTLFYDIAVKKGIISEEDTLLQPTYYLSKEITMETLQERAHATGQKWIFQGDESPELMERFRAKKKRGPLWEYLMY